MLGGSGSSSKHQALNACAIAVSCDEPSATMHQETSYLGQNLETIISLLTTLARTYLGIVHTEFP